MFNPLLRMRARIALLRSMRHKRFARPPDTPDGGRLARVEEALASMPPLTREVFMMHRFDDLAYTRIAVRLGIGVDEVEAHMATALKHLWRALENDR